MNSRRGCLMFALVIGAAALGFVLVVGATLYDRLSVFQRVF